MWFGSLVPISKFHGQFKWTKFAYFSDFFKILWAKQICTCKKLSVGQLYTHVKLKHFFVYIILSVYMYIVIVALLLIHVLSDRNACFTLSGQFVQLLQLHWSREIHISIPTYILYYSSRQAWNQFDRKLTKTCFHRNTCAYYFVCVARLTAVINKYTNNV